MTAFNDFDSFFSWYTSPEQPIRADSEEVRFILYVKTTLIDELSLIFS
jgi:hypothetical protein